MLIGKMTERVRARRGAQGVKAVKVVIIFHYLKTFENFPSTSYVQQ